MPNIANVARRLLANLREMRETEYRHIERFLEGGYTLDVGCGTGTFLARNPNHRVGVDLNPDNVQHCLDQKLQAQVGSALELPFGDNVFDAAVSSHLLQVFAPSDAATAVKELGRVVKPGGVVVISTLNSFPDFYQHPENQRPYPADALLRYFQVQRGATSPMWPGMPMMQQEDIWLRRPPLLKLRWSVRPRTNALFGVINRMQYGLYIVKPWAHESYVLKLRNRKA